MHQLSVSGSTARPSGLPAHFIDKPVIMYIPKEEQEKLDETPHAEPAGKIRP